MRKLLRIRHGERPWEGHMPPAGTLLFLQGNYMRVRRRDWTSPISPPDSLGKWGSWRSQSTFGQTRNHSPVCKPPILQDIGNLEQETTVIHTVTLLSPHTCANWDGGWRGSRTRRWSFQLRSAPSPTSQMTTGQGRACYILICLKHITIYHVHVTPVSLTYYAPHR